MQAKASITPLQEKFLTTLLADPNIKAAAKACKINESTAHRWMKQEAFQSAYKLARRQLVDRALAKLQIASENAVNTLLRNLQADTGASASIRGIQIRAAEAILEHAINSSEMAALLERIEQLENRLAHAYEDEFNDFAAAVGTVGSQNGARPTSTENGHALLGDPG